MDLLAGQQRSNQQASLLKIPTIRIHVSLDEPTVNVNFTALAEEKYGWDALHPVAARLRAANRYDSEEDSDSGPAQGEPQLTDGNDSAQQPRRKKKRRKDFDYYDVDDPFIDDDELAFQELTAASKDGFFVFQGPLVAEGEKVRIEKSDGTTKRPGKGPKNGRSKAKSASTVPAPKTPARPKAPVKDVAAPVSMVTSPKSNTETVAGPAVVNGTTTTGDAEVSGAELALPVKSVLATPSAPETTSVPEHAAVSTLINQSPPKKRLLSPAVLARRAEKAAERHAAKLNEKALAKEEKLKMTDGEKEARKAVKKMKLSDTASPAPGATSIAVSHDMSAASRSTSPTSPSATPMSGPPVGHAPSTPPVQMNPDGTVKKPRKPQREKTVEEKAELARRAKEARDRKRAEKLAKEAEEKAALLARAMANPLIDTSGVTLNAEDELARRAKELREQRQAEKLAKEASERAALLARALANPLIDTSGIIMPTQINPILAVKQELLPSAMPNIEQPIENQPKASPSQPYDPVRDAIPPILQARLEEVSQVQRAQFS